MSLLSTYLEKSENQEWNNDIFSLSEKRHGRVFVSTNTNYRTTESFITNFKTFLEIENIPRSQWVASGHGQEKHKQHVVPMRESKLFIQENDTFRRSAKGKLYSAFIEREYEQDERWILNYLFLCDSYFDRQNNYFVTESVNFIDKISAIFGREEALEIIKDFIIKSSRSSDLEELMKTDFFYIHSLYSDYDFLSAFKSAGEEERNEFKEYLIEKHNGGFKEDPISHKYVSGGNFSAPMIIDEAKIIFFSYNLSLLVDLDFEDVFVKITSFYNGYYPINFNNVKAFIFENSDIFKAIYITISGAEEREDYKEEIATETPVVQIEDAPKEKVDDTTYQGKQKLSREFTTLKRMAKESIDYRCALEPINNCKYFTSKHSKKNYLEIHHLIPREFRNDFEHSIEVIANYIPLCPKCHRMLHNAIDRERTPAINFLQNDRVRRLLASGLEIEVDTLYDYYKIDSSNR